MKEGLFFLFLFNFILKKVNKHEKESTMFSSPLA